MTKEDKTVNIYTDGACSGNPGPGGWAAVLLFGDLVKEVSGYETETTNNRMEMQAVIQGLAQLKVKGWQIRVHTDSAYVANAFAQDWVGRWQRNGWKTSKKEAVLNQELWQEMLRLMELNHVEMIKVKGHAGDRWNERCDELARQAAARAAALLDAGRHSGQG